MNWEPSARQRGGNARKRAPILDIIRKNAVHAFAEGGGRLTGRPCMTLAFAISPSSSARFAASCGACPLGAFLGPRGGEFAAKNKQSRYCEDDY
jgi:hypothetical protein